MQTGKGTGFGVDLQSQLRWYNPISGSQRGCHCSTQSLGLPSVNYLYWHFSCSQLLNHYMNRIQFSPITQLSSYLGFLWGTPRALESCLPLRLKIPPRLRPLCSPSKSKRYLCCIRWWGGKQTLLSHSSNIHLIPLTSKKLILIFLFHPGHCLRSTLVTAEFTDKQL